MSGPPESDNAIPDDVRRFILTSIPSVPYLEAVLQFRSQPAQPRSTSDIAQALYIPDEAAAQLLRQLHAAGVIETSPGGEETYAYAPSAALERALTALAEVYARNLVGVTELIHDTTRKQAQQFAQAFMLRRRT